MITRHEAVRGCGFRKKGALYLVSDSLGEPCGNLPIEVHVCPTCGTGIKPARGWTWIDIDKFVDRKNCGKKYCPLCPFNGHWGDKIGLIWIGGKYYPTIDKFQNEVDTMGVSRRITHIPKDFVLGVTWVALGHRKTIATECKSCDSKGYIGPDNIVCDECNGEGTIYKPGIFHGFKPMAIEYVVTGNESEKEIENLEKRGITLVDVIPIKNQQELI